MAEPVRVALLGAGRIVQRVHLHLLRRLSGLRVVSVAEADLERLAKAGQYVPRARRTVDWREALSAPDVEAVLICLPNALHADAAEAAFERGLHVYLEKPIATSVQDGERIVAAWRRSGRVGMTGFNYRFHPMHEAARRHLAEGDLGSLVAVRTRFTSPARPLAEWQQTRATGGGVLLNLGIHHADLVPFVTGARITAVAATVRTMDSEVDTAVVQAELEAGVPVQMLLSMNAPPADEITLVSERGSITADRLADGGLRVETLSPAAGRLAGVRQELGGLIGVARRTARALRDRSDTSFEIALTTFAAAVRGAAIDYPDLHAGLRAQRVIEAAERSAANGGGRVPVCGGDFG